MAHLKDQPTIADFQKFIQTVCIDKGWDKRTVLEKMLFLTEEVGELAKAVRKESGIYGYKKPKTTEHLAEEIVDVLNYILDLANVYDLDIESAFRAKWEKNATRQWDTA